MGFAACPGRVCGVEAGEGRWGLMVGEGAGGSGGGVGIPCPVCRAGPWFFLQQESLASRPDSGR